jgi:dihydroflavonol-4-reductase
VLLDAVRRHNVRLACVSSFTTLSRPCGGLKEWRAQLARRLHPYFAVKELIGARVLAAAREGLPVVVVNPARCAGPWDLRERDLCLIPRLAPRRCAGAIDNVLNVIDVRDVAAGLVAAPGAECYAEPILLSGHNVPGGTLFSWVCEIGGVRPPRFLAPLTLSFFATYRIEARQSRMEQPASLPSLAVMLAREHNWITLSAAQRELGITLRPLSETLLDAIEWYRSLGYR